MTTFHFTRNKKHYTKRAALPQKGYLSILLKDNLYPENTNRTQVFRKTKASFGFYNHYQYTTFVEIIK